jgi:hypothetical protein
MNVQLLIDAIVKQTTVLIAQLATAGGARAPLAHVANQVFLELVRELDEQGVSRKVGADMFGLALRSYQRKIQRLTESNTDRGRSLWEALLAHLEERKIATRNEILARFHRDDELLVRGVLHDLTESGLIFASGAGDGAVYRMATKEDLSHVRASEAQDSGAALDAMLWAVIYREGPIARDDIARRFPISLDILDVALDRLRDAARVVREGDGTYRCQELVVPYGSSVGWEAAVFDHFQSVVRTICSKLRIDQTPRLKDVVGGSTYTFVVWDGHPFDDEAQRRLAVYREQADDLRARIDAFNAEHGIPGKHRKVIAYAGQCVVDEEPET